MTLLIVQDAILAQLETLAQDIYDGAVPEDSKLKFDSNGNLLPYIVIEHAGVTALDAGAPITGVADASGESSVSILCIAPTQRASRQIAALVREKLTGFQTSGSGQLKPVTAPYTYISGTANPTRYVSEIIFSFTLNTVW